MLYQLSESWQLNNSFFRLTNCSNFDLYYTLSHNHLYINIQISKKLNRIIAMLTNYIERYLRYDKFYTFHQYTRYMTSTSNDLSILL